MNDISYIFGFSVKVIAIIALGVGIYTCSVRSTKSAEEKYLALKGIKTQCAKKCFPNLPIALELSDPRCACDLTRAFK